MYRHGRVGKPENSGFLGRPGIPRGRLEEVADGSTGLGGSSVFGLSTPRGDLDLRGDRDRSRRSRRGTDLSLDCSLDVSLESSPDPGLLLRASSPLASSASAASAASAIPRISASNASAAILSGVGDLFALRLIAASFASIAAICASALPSATAIKTIHELAFLAFRSDRAVFATSIFRPPSDGAEFANVTTNLRPLSSRSCSLAKAFNASLCQYLTRLIRENLRLRRCTRQMRSLSVGPFAGRLCGTLCLVISGGRTLRILGGGCIRLFGGRGCL